MTSKSHQRQFKHVKKKYKKLAAAVAGAAVLSSAMLPGIPATVNAAANPDSNANNTPVTTSQQIKTVEHAANPVQLNSNNPTVTMSHHNAPANYKEVLNIKATAYAPGRHDNDQWGNKTFTGKQIHPGIIAVDPHVIPLGSHVYIHYPDGHGEYAVAEDTGGAIKGNRIDVAKWTVKEAQDFGIQHVKVFVLNNSQNA